MPVNKDAPSPLGYSGTPLPKKLGIKPGAAVALLAAPKGFREQLGEVPADVTFTMRATGRVDVAVWFVTRRAELESRLPSLTNLAQGLWIAWPKKAAGVPGDLTENIVRDAGLANGLVDYKVCAIDATWSGLKFAKRKA